MITESEEALKIWEGACSEYDSFSEYALDELDAITIDGSDYANSVFEQLRYSKTWTYFWTGDQYILFPCTERQLIKGLRDQKKKQKEYDAEAEEEEQDSGLKRELEFQAERDKAMENVIVNKFHVKVTPIVLKEGDVDLTT